MGARRVNYLVSVKDAYRSYMRETKPSTRLSESQFAQLFEIFFKELLSYNMDKGKAAVLPYHLGKFYVVKYKPKKPHIDYNKTKSLKRKVLRDLDSTGGYVYVLQYRSTKQHKYNHVYRLTLSREFKKELQNKVKDYSKMGRYYPAFIVKN